VDRCDAVMLVPIKSQKVKTQTKGNHRVEDQEEMLHVRGVKKIKPPVGREKRNKRGGEGIMGGETEGEESK